jgi:hypothetical protein
VGRKTLRFAVRDADGRLSGTWRIWANKNDVYVTMKQVANDFKISLHESGSWQLGLTSTTQQELQGAGRWTYDSRHSTIWPRPSEIIEGLTSAFRILISTSELSSIPPLPQMLKNVQWIEAPEMGMVLEVSLWLSRILLAENDWPSRDLGGKLLDRFYLPSGEELLIVYRAISEEPWMQETIEIVRKQASFRSTALREGEAPPRERMRAYAAGPGIVVEFNMIPY